MDNRAQIFTAVEAELFDRILDFLEDTCQQQEGASQGGAVQGETRDVLLLNFTKVVNDCRAILLLAQSGFHIQAGILARSTTDACNLVMHIDVAEDDAALVQPWLAGRRVTHWMLVEKINENLERDLQLDIDSYRQMRRQLDDFVHANYEALKLYPAQLAGAPPADAATRQNLTFWKGLVYFYLIACLLAVPLIAPDLEVQAEDHLNRILALIHVRIPP